MSTWSKQKLIEITPQKLGGKKKSWGEKKKLKLKNLGKKKKKTWGEKKL